MRLNAYAFAAALSFTVMIDASGSPPGQITIVAMGDSTSAGTPFFLSPIESPPNGEGNPEGQYAHWMMKLRPGWKVLNRGVNGERTDQVRVRFDRDVVQSKPKIVIILAGVNDVYQGRPTEQTHQDLIWMYRESKNHGFQTIAASVLPFTNATGDQSRRINELNRWIAEEARKEKILFCDLHKVVADPSNSNRLNGSPDGLHPDLAGYRAMGEALVHFIEKSGHAENPR